jgi:hypothetical protein
MKKLLLGSTALVAGGLMAAPAMAADPIKIGIAGYYEFFVQAGNIDPLIAQQSAASASNFTQFKSLSFYQEGEIHFDGASKLDNGTTVGLHVELEGWNTPISTVAATGSVRQIDEAYLYAFGDWGRIEFGSRDGAGYRMLYGAPSALLNGGFFQHNSAFGFFNPTIQVQNLAAAHITFMALDGQIQDANRVNYFTPRIWGFQFGAGYAPKINIGGGVGPGNNTAGICGFNDATAVSACPTNDFSYQDMFDFGLNYLNKFGDITVALYGGYMLAQFVPGSLAFPAAANTTTGFNLASWRQMAFGAQFGFGGWTIGGSYHYDNNGIGANYYTGVDSDTRSFAAGIMYETGPWQLSAGWQGSRNNNGNGVTAVTAIAPGTNVATFGGGGAATCAAAFGLNAFAGALFFGQTTADKFEVGANYALGPGIKVVGGGQYFNFAGPANSTTATSWAVILGMELKF